MDIYSRPMFVSFRDIVIMGSLERIRVPLEIFSTAIKPFPLLGTSYKAYMELFIVLCIFMSPAPSKFPLFSFRMEIAALNSDKSSISSRL
jgi:hypothetical protein